MFYAVSSPYGSRVVYNECNPAELHVFDTRKERDAWVDADWEYREEVTRREARRYFGEPLIGDDDVICHQCHTVTRHPDYWDGQAICRDCLVANEEDHMLD